jgi:hypothetical protein
VINNLQKDRAPDSGTPASVRRMLSLMNSPSFSGAMPVLTFRVEDFEAALEFLPLGFLAKFLIPKQRFAVLLEFVTNVIE